MSLQWLRLTSSREKETSLTTFLSPSPLHDRPTPSSLTAAVEEGEVSGEEGEGSDGEGGEDCSSSSSSRFCREQ